MTAVEYLPFWRRLLAAFGYRVEYVCDWGVYEWRYNDCDYHFCRPIHRQMSVAPPWAKMKLIRVRSVHEDKLQ